MGYMFYESSFNGDISQWDTSNVTNMHNMFYYSQFNQDISKWNCNLRDYNEYMRSYRSQTIRIESKEQLQDIINNCSVDADLNNLDVSKLTDLSYLFKDHPFRGNISKWDVSNVTDMTCIFFNSQVNCDISQWDTSNVIDKSWAFDHSNMTFDIIKHVLGA